MSCPTCNAPLLSALGNDLEYCPRCGTLVNWIAQGITTVPTLVADRRTALALKACEGVADEVLEKLGLNAILTRLCTLETEAGKVLALLEEAHALTDEVPCYVALFDQLDGPFRTAVEKCRI